VFIQPVTSKAKLHTSYNVKQIQEHKLLLWPWTWTCIHAHTQLVQVLIPNQITCFVLKYIVCKTLGLNLDSSNTAPVRMDPVTQPQIFSRRCKIFGQEPPVNSSQFKPCSRQQGWGSCGWCSKPPTQQL